MLRYEKSNGKIRTTARTNTTVYDEVQRLMVHQLTYPAMGKFPCQDMRNPKAKTRERIASSNGSW